MCIKKLIKKTPFYKPIKVVYSTIWHIFMPLGWIRNYIIFPVKAFFRVRKISLFYKGYDSIEKFHNKYQGKRCFILATGPSFRISDAEELNDEYTFAVNSFYKCYDRTNFRPTFYVTLDPECPYSFSRTDSFEPSKYAKEASFMNSFSRKKFNFEDVIYLPVCYQNHWYATWMPNFDHSKNLKFSDNLLWGIYSKYTVTCSVIEIAIYMGFIEIYLLGVDCNYSSSKAHFTDTNFDPMFDRNFADTSRKAMTTGYRYLEKESKKRGVHIYNATRGGMLEEFDRVNFDEIIKNK